MTDQDKALSAALDHFDVPPARASLVDDIVAQALKVEPWDRPLRDRRSGWARRAMLGAAAFSLSAAAAASGWLGEPIRRLPVISSIAAVVPKAVQARPIATPIPKVATAQKPKAPEPKRPVPQTAQKAEVEPVVPAKPAEPSAPDLERQTRIERISERLEQRLDARDARRAARGLAPNSDAERTLVETLREAKSPEERQAARAAYKSIRDARRDDFRARRAARDAAVEAGVPPPRRPLCTAEQAAEPLRNGCRLPRAERLQGQRRFGRQCADMPPGAWIPPRCRQVPQALPREQGVEPIPE